jgi:serine/threonine protein kinase
MNFLNKTIGKYKLIRVIGEGGMAVVYEGEHERLGTRVAVKVLDPLLAKNEQLRKRFENEASFMASMNHPNITRVVDLEESEGVLAIIMELLNGQDLGDYIKQNGPLSKSEVGLIFKQVLSAFEYAHNMGIVHRDVKPANIILDELMQIKILDFGIAKIFGTGIEMTQTGTQMGTPSYMSPEQIKGEKAIDHRTDIYSLGVTLHYLLSGELSFEGDSTFEVFTRIINEPLPELSGNNAVFNKIIEKATAKDRNNRYQYVSDLILDIQKTIEGTADYSSLQIDGSTRHDEQIVQVPIHSILARIAFISTIINTLIFFVFRAGMLKFISPFFSILILIIAVNASKYSKKRKARNGWMADVSIVVSVLILVMTFIILYLIYLY